MTRPTETIPTNRLNKLTNRGHKCFRVVSTWRSITCGLPAKPLQIQKKLRTNGQTKRIVHFAGFPTCSLGKGNWSAGKDYGWTGAIRVAMQRGQAGTWAHLARV